MFKEFPKCLYQGGDVQAAYRVVPDAKAEADARDEGFLSAGESHEKADSAKRKAKAH